MITLNFLFYVAASYLAINTIIVMITLQIYKLSSWSSSTLLLCAVYTLTYLIAKMLGGF